MNGFITQDSSIYDSTHEDSPTLDNEQTNESANHQNQEEFLSILPMIDEEIENPMPDTLSGDSTMQWEARMDAMFSQMSQCAQLSCDVDEDWLHAVMMTETMTYDDLQLYRSQINEENYAITLLSIDYCTAETYFMRGMSPIIDEEKEDVYTITLSLSPEEDEIPEEDESVPKFSVLAKRYDADKRTIIWNVFIELWLLQDLEIMYSYDVLEKLFFLTISYCGRWSINGPFVNKNLFKDLKSVNCCC